MRPDALLHRKLNSATVALRTEPRQAQRALHATSYRAMAFSRLRHVRPVDQLQQ